MRDFTEGRTGKLMTDELQYDEMVERALRGVMVEALTLAAEHGLPGNHHFYVTFKTEAPGVNIPTHLAARYPDEMTIVLQFQYWDLEISDEGLAVTLSFNDVRERLIVPFAALLASPTRRLNLACSFRPSPRMNWKRRPTPPTRCPTRRSERPRTRPRQGMRQWPAAKSSRSIIFVKRNKHPNGI